MELIQDIHMLDLNSRLDLLSLIRFKKGGEQDDSLAQKATAYLLKSFKKNKYNSESARKKLCQALRFPNHASPCVTIQGMFMVSRNTKKSLCIRMVNIVWKYSSDIPTISTSD
jgi:hypothetical protein